MAVTSCGAHPLEARHTPHPATRIADCFVALVDPRLRRSRRHDLRDIVTIAVCAVPSGADTYVDIAYWGQAKRDWLAD